MGSSSFIQTILHSSINQTRHLTYHSSHQFCQLHWSYRVRIAEFWYVKSGAVYSFNIQYDGYWSEVWKWIITSMWELSKYYKKKRQFVKKKLLHLFLIEVKNVCSKLQFNQAHWISDLHDCLHYICLIIRTSYERKKYFQFHVTDKKFSLLKGTSEYTTSHPNSPKMKRRIKKKQYMSKYIY